VWSDAGGGAGTGAPAATGGGGAAYLVWVPYIMFFNFFINI